jgi:ABC-type amino acid transport substrate-binding protein/signal transduction histidine kinase
MLRRISRKYSGHNIRALLALCATLALRVSAVDEPVAPLAAGCEIDYPPFCIVHEDGRADGFSVELLRAALARMGREVTFRAGPWSEVRGWLESGEVDCLPLVGRTPEREALFDFTVPYLTMHGAIVVRKDTEDIHSLADLRGRRVGVMKDDNAEEFLRREDRGIEIVTTPTFPDAFRELSEGRCDAVVIQRLVALRLIEQTALTNLRIIDRRIPGFSQAWCFAVKDGDRATLSLLNEGLALVVADGTRRRLHAKWFASLVLPSDRPITIGGDHNYPPFEYLDEKGRPAGFTVELTRAIAREMNLDVRFRLGPWETIVAGLDNGDIDAMQGMFYTPERDRSLDFSPRYLASHYVGLTRADAGTPPKTLDEMAGQRIAIQAGDAILETIAEGGIDIVIVAVETQEEVLRAVRDGRADRGVVVRISALHFIENNGWHDLLVGKEALFIGEYCYAVPQGREALLAQFAEGLSSVKASGEYHRLYEKWMGVYEEHFHWGDVLKIVVLVAGPLLLIALLALLWSWGLRKQVARRTAELRASLERQVRGEARMEHLLQVLRAIRDVNQLITHEEDRDALLRRSCEILISTRGYRSAWVALRDADGNLDSTAESGIGDGFDVVRAAMERGDWPNCCRQAWEHPDSVTLIHNPDRNCKSCSLAHTYRDTAALAGALRHGEGDYGVLVVALPAGLADDPEEQSLFRELVGDVAYALYAMENAQHRREEEAKRESLEARLRQAQKMESVGRLAGGVAHDFNNMIMGVMGYAELCRESIAPDHPAREWLDEITREVERSANLTRQLLAFARKQTIAPHVLDLNDAVGNMLKMLRRLIGENIDLTWQPGAELWPVKLDPGQVDQILANLCVNARDAIVLPALPGTPPRQTGGTGKVTIETGNVSIDKEYCAEHIEASPGEFVVLAVSDNGCGMGRETLDNIFEPFFTTKGIGEGTGLGLATVHGIVKQNEGFVNVYSEPGNGTTFRIYLPRVAEAAANRKQAPETAAPLRGTETILLVEDEKSIRVTLGLFLKDLGYTVLSTDSPAAALGLAAEQADGIDLLLTDVVMPGMSGRELAERLAPDHPAMKVFYMSGYTANVIAHRGILEEGVHFVSKPVSRDVLAAKVREVLGAG